MPIITPADLKTHIYPEIQDLISRADTSIVTTAIDAAVDEAKMYLSRFDRLALFGNDNASPPVAATFTSPALIQWVKNIATWHLIRLAPPNIDTPITRSNYEDTIRALRDIQKGTAEPDGWPLYDATKDAQPIGDSVYFTSQPKRTNNY